MHYSHLLHHLQLCAKRQLPSQGKTIHAHIIRTGLDQHQPFPNTLINLYGKCGLIEDAVQMFDGMLHRDHVSWASLLTAHNQASLPHRTLAMFPNMFPLDGLQPDHFIFACLVKACASLGALRVAKQVHTRFLLSPFSKDEVVKSSLLDMYAKCGLVDIARLVFDSMSFKNVISWTAMVSGYATSGRKSEAIKLLDGMCDKNLVSWTALISGLVQSGHWVDAFNLFIEMRREGMDIEDPFILSSIVGASANFSALELGKQVHCLVLALGYESSLFVSNALVDMYGKCSDVIAAKSVFDNILVKDVVSWTSIIVGMAQHGRAEEALSLYDKMILTGLKPNEVTFVGLVYACSHVGLVSKGRQLFKSMVEDYGLSPSLLHYTCLLDLFSRSGHLDEAENLLNTMPFRPDEAAWAALLSACKKHGNTQLGVRVSNQLLSLKPENPSTYILLSNVYASASMWECVSKVRKLMVVEEFKKEPGYSCIDLGKESQVFCAGEETANPSKGEIYVLLKELDAEMRTRGYVPDTSWVLHDMEEQEKERQLFWHSERLAVAYGLLKAVPGTVIRVVKNLRVCGDCHTVLKYICSIMTREIVVRDAKRFHHFKNGQCSCSDFW
ncbi:hypothetical protein RJ640_025127 [Escallonia rubra]|uniref:DYW domain-containing protein n=1 Tax=Escallonia rubra TaxID=112253 RepID=A0AA88RVK7_9ASTE|nr:hypothetical protein RJ640_025127 [Escallonia rubra]